MNRKKSKAAVISTGLFLLSILTSCGPAQQRQTSDHFNGKQFFNREPGHSTLDTIKWMWEMETIPWPAWIKDPQQPPPAARVGPGDLRIYYINHATTLIQMDGLNILTDPIWSLRAGPFSWLGAKRIRAPGIRFEDLPPIDYVLISHDHYDHLDLSTIKRLAQHHRPRFITGLKVGELLSDENIENVIELDWWEFHQADQAGIRFYFVPARHGSGRGPLGQNKTLWGGFIIDSSHGQVYFAGDTAYGGFVTDLAERFDRIRLALLPIGSYEKRWFMKSQHMNPNDAVKTHLLLSARQSAGIHFATFAEHPEQSIDAHEKDLARALQTHDLTEDYFWILGFGEGKDVPPLPRVARKQP